MLTSLNFSPIDVLLTELPPYTQTKGGSTGFTECDHVVSISCEAKPSFVRTDTIFPFSSDMQYTSEKIEDDHSNIHHVSSLNV